MEYLKVLKNRGPHFENHMNSATVIHFQIQSDFLFHEFCYYTIQIIVKTCMKYRHLLFNYLCY